MTDTPRRRLILALYFLSGVAGLVYQITWMRMMNLVFGITVYAAATVLCSFMAGLALGSLFIGRRAGVMRRPLAAYGLLEIGIGVFALAFAPMLDAVTPLFATMYHRFGETGGVTFALARVAIIFPMLLVPTFMMGGTFPVVCRAFVRDREDGGSETGYLYAANTAGAVAGAGLAGFILLAEFGVRESIHAAAALNICVGLVSIALDRNPRGADTTPESIPAGEPAPADINYNNLEASDVPGSLVIAALGLSGFASLALEVLWTRVLVFHTHNSTYAFTSMLIAFLTGIAIGGWFAGRILHRVRKRVSLLAACEIGIGIWSLVSILLLEKIPRLSEFLARVIPFNNWSETALVLLAQVFLILFAPAFLMGITIPLGVSILRGRAGGTPRTVGDLYAANSAGTVMGSLLCGFLFIPLLGVRDSFLLIAGINLFVGAVLVLRSNETHAGYRGGIAIACFLVLVSSHFIIPRDAVRGEFEKRLGKVIHYHEGVTDTTMVIDLYSDRRNGRNPDPANRMLVFSDGRGTAGHNSVTEDRYYAHLPMLLHKDPREVLLICVGAGNTLNAFASYSSVTRIDAVELSSGVLAASPHFALTNEGVLQSGDERIRLHVEDGRVHLAGTRRMYDIIHLDPPELHSAGVVFLYTKEFHEAVRRRLRPGGVYSHWFNATKLSTPEMKMIIATFLDVFPHGTVWQGPAGYSWNLIATGDGDVSISPARLDCILAEEPAARTNMISGGIAGPYDILATYTMSPRSASVFSDGAPVLTDNRTRIDFSNAKSPYAGFGVLNLYLSYDGSRMFGTPDATDQSAPPPPELTGGWNVVIRCGLESDDPRTLIESGEEDVVLKSGIEASLDAAREKRMRALRMLEAAYNPAAGSGADREAREEDGP